MNYLFVIIVFIMAVYMGWIIIPQILLIAFRKRLFDVVDGRKVHIGVIPRLGGVAFTPVQSCLLALSMFFMYKFNIVSFSSDAFSILPIFLLLMCGLIILFMVGMVDDLIGMNYRWKFVAQIIAASLFPLSGLWINNLYGLLGITVLPAWFGMPLTVFVVVFIVNAINLIDGIDGLCSGLAAIGCAILGGLFIYNNAWMHAVFAFITTGVLIPFFYCNVFGKFNSKQRIFMGDTGSLTLGLSVSFLAISYAMYNPDIKPFSEGAIVVSFATLIVPIFDVVRVICLRLRTHKPLFLPDRNHIHHKFLRLGISHRATMILILSMALFFSALNIVAVEYISNNIVLLVDILLWISFHLWLDKVESFKLEHKMSEQLK